MQAPPDAGRSTASHANANSAKDTQRLLSHPDASKRTQALLTLRAHGCRPSRSTYRLVAAMVATDPDRTVRIMCCHAMKWAPPSVAVPALLAVLADHSEFASVRQEAMEALAYQPRECVPEAAVAAGLLDRSPLVRFFAAYAAGELGFSSTKPILRGLVEDDRASTPFGRVRTVARRAIDRLK